MPAVLTDGEMVDPHLIGEFSLGDHIPEHLGGGDRRYLGGGDGSALGVDGHVAEGVPPEGHRADGVRIDCA